MYLKFLDFLVSRFCLYLAFRKQDKVISYILSLSPHNKNKNTSQIQYILFTYHVDVSIKRSESKSKSKYIIS